MVKTFLRRIATGAIGTATAVLLAACGGGDGGGAGTPAPQTLQGTAAVGAPIEGGTVQVSCSSGSLLQTTTSSSGVWQVTINGQTAPCAVQVSGGSLLGGQTYHSITATFNVGALNITPLTDLVVAQVAGKDPAAWFAALNAQTLNDVNAQTIEAAVAKLRTALNLTALNSIDPITTAFNAQAGNPMDDVLEALQTAMSQQSLTYANLLAAFYGDSVDVGVMFRTALTNAYAVLTGGGGSGGGSGGGTGTCAAGSTTLPYSGTAGLYTQGQEVCFTASSTSLVFSDKTLTNPVQNTAVTLPYTAYSFTDSSNGYVYEVVFNNGSLYEINVSNGATFMGQFAASSNSGGGGTDGSGNYTLTLDVFLSETPSGTPAATLNITNLPKPDTQDEFCGEVVNGTGDASIQQAFSQAGVAGSLTLNSCSFSGNVGTVSLTLTMTSPVSMSVPYSARYTYN